MCLRTLTVSEYILGHRLMASQNREVRGQFGSEGPAICTPDVLDRCAVDLSLYAKLCHCYTVILVYLADICSDICL